MPTFRVSVRVDGTFDFVLTAEGVEEARKEVIRRFASLGLVEDEFNFWSNGEPEELD